MPLAVMDLFITENDDLAKVTLQQGQGPMSGDLHQKVKVTCGHDNYINIEVTFIKIVMTFTKVKLTS